MNPVITALAKELAGQLNNIVNLPFLNEEEEEAFFRLVVTRIMELTLGQLFKLASPPQKSET